MRKECCHQPYELGLDFFQGSSRYEPSLGCPLIISFFKGQLSHVCLSVCENPNTTGFKNKESYYLPWQNVQILGRFQGWLVKQFNIKDYICPTLYPQFNSPPLPMWTEWLQQCQPSHPDVGILRSKNGPHLPDVPFKSQSLLKLLPEENPHIIAIRTWLQAHLQTNYCQRNCARQYDLFIPSGFNLSVGKEVPYFIDS